MFMVYEDWPANSLATVQTPETQLYQSKKGRGFNIRHLEESDTALLTDFMSRLSSSTLWTRFFVPYPSLSDEVINRELARLKQISNSNGAVLVATTYVDGKQEIIAVVEIIPREELFSTAELALTIRDDYQGEGIGSALALQLVEEATKKGIATLRAEAMAHNQTILHLWTKLGLPYSFHTHHNITDMIAWLGGKENLPPSTMSLY